MANKGWTQQALNQHLDLAIATELYTIPLYLSAASSIVQTPLPRDQQFKPRKNWVVEVSDGETTKQFRVFNSIISVAVQEMYHLLWACNLSTALGNVPNLTAPDYSKPPAYLKLKGLPDLPGSLSDVIDLMVAIETPDPKYGEDYLADPEAFEGAPGPTGPTLETYGSIADLYHALASGVQWYFKSGKSVTGHRQVTYRGSFQESYAAVGKITGLASALEAIVAIVEQGEGVGVDKALPAALEDPGKLVAGKPVATESKFSEEDKYSHYERFRAVQQSLQKKQFRYSSDPEPWATAGAAAPSAAGKTAGKAPAAGAGKAPAAAPAAPAAPVVEKTLTEPIPVVVPTGTTSLTSNLTTLLAAINDSYRGKASLASPFYCAMFNFGSALDLAWASRLRPTF